MSVDSTGRVLTEARIETVGDLWAVEHGLLPADQIRRITVPDAVVDTGSTTLALPTRLIRQLGLTMSYQKFAASSRGVGPVSVYSAVRLTLLDRFCTLDVMEAPDDVPPLIG